MLYPFERCKKQQNAAQGKNTTCIFDVPDKLDETVAFVAGEHKRNWLFVCSGLRRACETVPGSVKLQ